MSQRDMNPVMYGILKMVKYKVQIITFSQNFMIFKHTNKANCVRYPKRSMVKDTDAVYIALLKTTSLCTFVAEKVIDPLRQYFYIF